MKGPIQVWRFTEAPEHLQKLSPHGGDEDWVALFPDREQTSDFRGWWGPGSNFGRCRVSVHDLPDGTRVLIGAHS